MSASENQEVAALREAGFDDAADHLADLAGKREALEQRQEQERKARQQLAPGIPLVSGDRFQAERQAEAHVVAEQLRQSGFGQSWASAGPIFGDDRSGR